MGKILPEIQHNCCIKRYPDGGAEILACAAAVFRERGWEAADKWEAEPRAAAAEHPDIAGNLARAKRRARTMVRDYARANDFTHFVTLTLDASRVTNRYDIDACTRDIRVTLDNLVRRKGLQYVLVPEEHKDGAIHYHGFINAALPLVDSGTLSKGGGTPHKPRSARQREQWLAEGWNVVYNVPAWKFGFSTAIALYGERDAAIGYVCKYITKAQRKLGGRWYYSGGGLALPSMEYCDVDFEQLSAAEAEHRFAVDALGCEMVRCYVRRWDDEAAARFGAVPRQPE